MFKMRDMNCADRGRLDRFVVVGWNKLCFCD